MATVMVFALLSFYLGTSFFVMKFTYLSTFEILLCSDKHLFMVTECFISQGKPFIINC